MLRPPAAFCPAPGAEDRRLARSCLTGEMCVSGLRGKPLVPGGGNIFGVGGLKREEGAGKSQVVPQPAGQSLLVKGTFVETDVNS